MGACAVLGIRNQDALSKDLENDPFLNSALQRFTCELYYRFSSFLAPLSVGLILAGIIYLSTIKMEEQEEQKTSKNSSTSSKSGTAYEVIGSFIGIGMVGFCFGIGVILVVKTVNSLECCIEELISRK